MHVRHRHGSSALVHPEKTTVNVPISIKGKPGSLLITSHPNDEMAEIWDGIITQLQIGTAIALVLFLITTRVVSRALAPIQTLSEAMTKIEAGGYDTRVKPDGPPELTAICDKLNHLAATLGNAVDDKRRLAERIVSLQDVERKEIARELHDEFGPDLFALRAHASALTRMADVGGAKCGGHTKARQRDIGTGECLAADQSAGAGKAAAGGIDGTRPSRSARRAAAPMEKSHPDVVIETAISRSLGDTGETADLTIYRTIQEALTNVFRHAGATSRQRNR